MIELSASSENAFKLYNFLNKGERKHIKVNGILLDKIKKNICVFILMKQCSGILNRMNNGLSTNVLDIFRIFLIFIEKKLLLTVNLWPEVEKFISSLDKSIMDSVRISHHPNWNGICWNSIKDEKCYDVYSNPKVVPFRSEATSIGMK